LEMGCIQYLQKEINCALLFSTSGYVKSKQYTMLPTHNSSYPMRLRADQTIPITYDRTPFIYLQAKYSPHMTSLKMVIIS
jgi:hypothetical protein